MIYVMVFLAVILGDKQELAYSGQAFTTEAECVKAIPEVTKKFKEAFKEVDPKNKIEKVECRKVD